MPANHVFHTLSTLKGLPSDNVFKVRFIYFTPLKDVFSFLVCHNSEQFHTNPDEPTQKE